MNAWMRTLVSLLALALLASACGSGGDGDAEAAGEHDHADHDHSHDETAQVDPAELPSELEVEADDGERIRLAMAHTCIEPGSEQGFSVDAWPETNVLYQAVYAGGRHGATAEYPGGNDRGTTDENGGFEASWVVGDSAPMGPVAFQVVVLGHGKPVMAGFKVAEECAA